MAIGGFVEFGPHEMNIERGYNLGPVITTATNSDVTIRTLKAPDRMHSVPFVCYPSFLESHDSRRGSSCDEMD
jgi:hypothetical protein